MFVIIYIVSHKTGTETVMSFREKIAWVSLGGIVFAGILYFGNLATHDAPHPYFIGLFVAVMLAQAVITALAAIAVAVLAPADARAPRDERDRGIARRAAGQSYYALLLGVMAAAVTIHFGVSLFGMLNLLLAVIMLAEAMRFACQIIAYRRGN
jgi:ABC-type xylose transport system permease subunit